MCHDANITESDDAKTLAARRWFGWGRWDAPYWFIGMEPGGPDVDASPEAWMRLGGAELVDCQKHHLCSSNFKWHAGHRPPTQPTWIRLIQLLLGYEGKLTGLEGKQAALNATSLYQRDKWGALTGDTAVLELSGLHARNTRTQVCRAAWRDPRIKTLRERLREHHPTFAIFYGVKNKKAYETITDTRLDVHSYAWHGTTLCVLVRHPTGRSNPQDMKSEKWWITKGREMRSAVEERSHTASVQVRPPIRPREATKDRADHETDLIPSDVIRVLTDHNPKSGQSFQRFACYRDGMTVEEYKNAVRQRLGRVHYKCKSDLKWDSDRRFIRIERDGKPIDNLAIPRWTRHP